MIPRPSRRQIASLLFGMALFAPLGPAIAGQDVTVFAAASLKTALDAVVHDYSATTGDVVHLSYAGSSALARQIQFGAPAHVFISANPLWMDLIERDGLLAPETRRDLLGNSLVLIAGPGVPEPPPISPGFDLAAALGQGRLAMALVDAVPAGLYGRAALQSLGVWDALADRIAQTDSVRAALRLVAVGEAPLGIVYATDARAEARVRVVGVFPPETHPPIVYPAAILKAGDTDQARRFYSYLTGPQARVVFEENGFVAVGADPGTDR
jgi:molybdate transport system substrate-binding protein